MHKRSEHLQLRGMDVGFGEFLDFSVLEYPKMAITETFT